MNETATRDAPRTREASRAHEDVQAPAPDAHEIDHVMVDARKTFLITLISVGLFIGVVISFILF